MGEKYKAGERVRFTTSTGREWVGTVLAVVAGGLGDPLLLIESQGPNHVRLASEVQRVRKETKERR